VFRVPVCITMDELTGKLIDRLPLVECTIYLFMMAGGLIESKLFKPLLFSRALGTPV
jgi:hypothetical protein